ncbi:MAG: hypothetical protein LBK94_02930 [Prevotellaceae bacterium]|jgi:hypothetical protein|nr:hypothetical protein [Prevotellaceae bacterium]
MKKKLFIIPAIMLLVSACSQIFAPSVYSSKAMDALTADLKKISENFKIEKVIVNEKENLSNEFGMCIVDLRNSEGEKYEQILYYNIGIPHNDPESKRELRRNTKEPDGINVDDIISQKDNIEKYVENAKSQIPETYKFESVNRLTFTADEGSLEISFIINVTEKGKSARMKGGREVIDYYEVEFNVDKDGNVILNDNK